MPRLRAAATPKAPEQKLTINLGVVDLGQVDLLVREGFYSNRSDFIRAAVRAQIDRHADTVGDITTRKAFVTGLHQVTAQSLRATVACGEQLELRVLGLLVIDNDVTPALALSAIASITVLGHLQASADVRHALADRCL